MQEERRLRQDRRREHKPFSIHSLYGRRRGPRRRQDPAAGVAISDFYNPTILYVTLGILILCVLDAFNTLVLMSLGALELNPFMNQLIQQDVHLFVIAKLALTGLGVLLLVAHHSLPIWRGIRVRHLLYATFTGYLTLICYQSLLLPGGMQLAMLP